jgi:hypothetical protein
MIVVADSTPLIYLAAIARFDLLTALFGNVLIPPAVYDEVVTQGFGQWGASEVRTANWIKQQDIHDRNKSAALLNLIGPGESEAIVLAEEVNADLVLMDETAGRRELNNRGLRYMGTVGVLFRAKHNGLIPALKPELDKLQVCGFYLSERIRRDVLATAGE